MAIYVTRKCPKCKYSFERMALDWIAFGDPRIKCPRCGQIVVFKNIKEWKLRHPLMRFWIIVRHYTFHNIAYTSGLVMLFFLLLALILSLFGKSINEVIQEENSIFFWTTISIIVFVIVAIYRHKGFIKEIRESNERMKNLEYAEKMKSISLKYK